MPLISIIMPVYNARARLSASVGSALAQTLEDLELLLIDDGSTDGSGELCDELAARDGRIRVIHQSNAGPSSARNAGLAAARGEYIGFVDADDVIEPHMYEALLGRLIKTSADAARCGLRMIRRGENGLERECGATDYRDEALTGAQYRERTLDGGGMYNGVMLLLIKAPLAKAIGFKDELRGGEDFYYNFALSFAAGQVAVTAERYYNYYLHGDSLSHGQNAAFGIGAGEAYLLAADKCGELGEAENARRAYSRAVWETANGAALAPKTEAEKERYARLYARLRQSRGLFERGALARREHLRCRLYLFSHALYTLTARLYRMTKGIPQ